MARRRADQTEDADWPDETGGDLLWRVRVIRVSDDEIVVEQPSAAGQTIALAEGLELIAVMAVGQNRWMFRTTITGALTAGINSRSGALRLVMPTDVERCQRRNFYRTSTAELTLPGVECWPILSPPSIVSAEVANRAQITDLRQRGVVSKAGEPTNSIALPEVGPKFGGRLINLGGGGVGILISQTEGNLAEELRLYWVQMDLRPQVPAPLGVTAKIVHRHIDSAMNVYCGLAFEFGYNPSHRQFVIDEISQYAASVQADQLRSIRKAG